MYIHHISFKENNLKLGFYEYTIFLHFTILPIRKLPEATAEITGDFRRLPAPNDIPDMVVNPHPKAKVKVKFLMSVNPHPKPKVKVRFLMSVNSHPKAKVKVRFIMSSILTQKRK